MKISPHRLRGVVTGAAVPAAYACVRAATRSSGVVGETPPPDPPASNSYTITLGPPAYFFTDPGEEYGGLQVTESLNSWSSGIYWEFLDLYSSPILTLQTVGTGHYVGASVADIDAFKTALGSALDTVDEGLMVSFINDTFTVVFTAIPVIGGNEIKFLHMASEVGNTAAFATPVPLVTI